MSTKIFEFVSQVVGREGDLAAVVASNGQGKGRRLEITTLHDLVALDNDDAVRLAVAIFKEFRPYLFDREAIAAACGIAGHLSLMPDAQTSADTLASHAWYIYDAVLAHGGRRVEAKQG